MRARSTCVDGVQRLAAVACVALFSGLGARAQEGASGWGYQAFDTRWNTEVLAQVSGGVQHTVALRLDGRVAAWGGNWAGQCEAPAPPPGTWYTKVAAGFDFSAALRSDGVIDAWGENAYGQCNVPAYSDFVDLDAGAFHCLARRANGSLVAWGHNAYGQCNVPTGAFVEVSAAEYYSLARRANGTIAAWGRNSFGQLNVPALPPGTTYVEVSAGGALLGNCHAVARRSDDVVVVWGSSAYNTYNVPTPPAGVTYVDIDAGGEYTLARRSDGVVVAWGANAWNQSNVPAFAVPPIAISAGGYHALVLRASGTIGAWGANYFSQCNIPPTPAGVTYTHVDGGGRFTAALRSDGVLRVWGQTYGNELAAPSAPPGVSFVDVRAGEYGGGVLRGDGDITMWGDGYQQAPPSLPSGLSYVDFELGYVHAIALRSDGEVVVWGQNSAGQAAVPALPPGLRYVDVAAGRLHALALRSDGLVFGWGDNSYGQCNFPAPPTGVVYTRLSAAAYASAALRSDGAIVVRGPASVSTPPTNPLGVYNADVAVGGYYECDGYGVCEHYKFAYAARSDGGLSAWGDTDWGVNLPPQLPDGASFTEVRPGGWHAAGTWSTLRGLDLSYCASSVTTAGCTPLIHATGRASASAATSFVLDVSSVEDQRNGLFFYGLDNSGFAPQAWALGSTSRLCVKAPRQRTPQMFSGGMSQPCDGAFTLDWNAFLGANPSVLGAPFAVGERVYAQAWFRDPGTPGGTNLSNAYSFVHGP